MSRKRKSIDRGVIIVGRDSTAKVSDEDFDFLNVFTWHRNTRGHGYAATNIDRNIALMHRIVYERMSGSPCVPGMFVDHKDRDCLNNQRDNLRMVTPSLNNHNRAKKQGTVSRYIGVSSRPGGLWNAACQQESKRFKTETAAAYYYDQLAVKKYGADANINGIDKPLDFEDAMVTGPPRHAREDRCITRRGTRFSVQFTTHATSTTASTSASYTCDTIEEARAWRDDFDKRRMEAKEIELQTREITRNADGVAYIQTNGKIQGRVLVDDDVWRSLQGASCSIGVYGYAHTAHLGRKQMVHTIIMNRVGVVDGLVIDHINHDKLDNRRSNLRVVTRSINAHNKTLKGQYVGVRHRSGRWWATISFNACVHPLGSFSSAQDAALAYNTKAVELYGPVANLNVIE